MTPKEEWRQVYGYENLYEVSNFGRVRSLDKYDSRGHFRAGFVLKPSIRSNNSQYLRVGLTKDGIRKHKNVHRIVATSFLPNPQNLPQVNHKDENKLNNYVENLEWCTASYNANYGTRQKRIIEKRSRAIIGESLDKDIKIYLKSSRSGDFIGFRHSAITACAKGKRHTHKCFKWRYSNETH